MGETELKPCPCGGEGMLIHHLNPHFDMVWGVKCQSCGKIEDDYIEPEGAIVAWNRRTDDG